MIDIFVEWVGRLLIKVGRNLIDHSRARDYARATRFSRRDRYYW